MKKSTFLILAGILAAIAVIFADIFFGKTRIILGVKSLLLLSGSLLLAIYGLVLARNNEKKPKSWHLFILFLIIILHLGGTINSLPVSELLSSHPLNTVDYSFHFYQAHTASKFFSLSGRFWGYDPDFMAGYPMGTVFDLNNKCYGLFTALFSFLGTVAASKIFVFFFLCFVPAPSYLSCRFFGLDKRASIAGSILAVLLWFTDSSLRPNWLGGMFSNAFLSYLCVFLISMFYRYLEKNTYSMFFFMVITGTVLFYMGTSFVVILPCIGIIMVMLLLEKKYRSFSAMVLWNILVFILCSIWIIPFLRFLHYKTDSSHCFFAGLGTFIRDFITFDGVSPCSNMPRTLFARNLITFTGIYGICLWIKENQKLKYIPIAVTLAFLYVISYCGSWLEFTSDLQPYRFISSINFIMIVPAAKAVMSLWDNVLKKSLYPKLLLTLLTLSCLPFITGGLVQWLNSPAISGSLTRQEEEVISWINANTSNSARILYESSYEKIFPSLLPYYTGRQYIGGLYPKVFLKHGFTQFNSWSLFGKNFRDLAFQDIEKYFECYNIKWIFCFSSEPVGFFDKYPSYIKKVTGISGLKVYEVKRQPDFFLKGSGELSAGYNLIKLKNVRGNEIIIKYHWLESLRTVPELKLEEIKVLDDPVGFIKIYNNGVKDFRIINKY